MRFRYNIRNRVPTSVSEKVFDLVMIVATFIVAVTMLYPVLFVLKQSLSSPNTVGLATLSLIPKEFSSAGYQYILRTRYVWTGFSNTVIRVILSTSLGLIVATGYAYPLSKKNLPFRNTLTLFIVITMFISGGLIPRYLLVRNLSLMNSMWSMVLPNLAKAFNLIIMRNFFMNIPVELEEAADIDGCNSIQAFLKIILPISMPIIATIGLWIMVDNWNAWFDCMLYITDPAKLVIQVVLRKIVFETSNEMLQTQIIRDSEISQDVVKYAVIIVATVPILMVYPFIQKYFVKGVIVGSLKG